MTSTSASLDTRTSATPGGAAAGRVRRRTGLPSTRAVIGALLMAVAAVGTFLAYAGATTDGSVDVLIATRDLRPGEVVAAEDVGLVAVDLPTEVGGLFGSVEAATGRRMVAPVDAGEFLQASSAVPPADGDERLEVAVAVPAARAVGRLVSGERVDVFSTWSGSVTELIAVDARVLEVRGAASPALSGSELVTVRLGLGDFDQVEAIVHAQAAGDITIIRAALGTTVEDVGREYRALSGAGSPADGGDARRDPGS